MCNQLGIYDYFSSLKCVAITCQISEPLDTRQVVTEQETGRTPVKNKTTIHRLCSFQPGELLGFERSTSIFLKKLRNCVIKYFQISLYQKIANLFAAVSKRKCKSKTYWMFSNWKNILGCKLHTTQYNPCCIRKLVAIIFPYRKYLLSSNVVSFSQNLKFCFTFLLAHRAVSTLPPEEVCRRPKWGQHSRR